MSKFMPNQLNKALLEKAHELTETPVFLCSTQTVAHNFRYFCRTLRLLADQVYYSVKTNNSQAVLNCLHKQGSNFEIASLGELEILKRQNIAPQRILFSNPIKITEHLKLAHDYGIAVFAFDSATELHKINQYAKGAKVFLRVRVDNAGASWELSHKFGADASDAVALFKLAEELELEPAGISFHVGWNNTSTDTWKQVINDMKDLALNLKMVFPTFSFLNIGGGYPAHLVDQYAFLQSLSTTLVDLTSNLNNNGLKLIAEPGSFLTANSTTLITRIIEKRERANGEKILFIDASAFNGFYWVLSGLRYGIAPVGKQWENKPTANYKIHGPTLDSQDSFGQDFTLPEGIKSGDLLCIQPAGAYIQSSLSYNGFCMPKSIDI